MFLYSISQHVASCYFFRSCEQAGIASHWCACNEYEQLDRLGETAVNGGQHVVRLLNGLLAEYRASVRKGYVCAELTLGKTVSARRRRRTDRSTGGGRLEYLFVVETLPGGSMFEVTVDQGDGDRAFGDLGDVSRINLYGYQSWCTNDWRMKKHCYCVKGVKGGAAVGRGSPGPK